MSPSEQHPATKLKIVLIGAGLGGLSAGISCAQSGHEVLILESAKALTEIGAGLQVTPNATRILIAWGLGPEVERLGAEPHLLAVHRYANNKILASSPNLREKTRKRYNAPFVDMHRADLQRMLHTKALECGVTIRTGARVTDVQTPSGSRAEVILDSGESIPADLVVGADGLWSHSRELLLGRPDPPVPTGDLAYRIVLDLASITSPSIRALISHPEVHFWIGPHAHAVGYSLRHGEMYNLVLLVPDDLPPDVARQPGSLDEMKQLFEGWDPIFRSLLDQVEKVDKWKLMHRGELETWTNEQGNFALMGDACHPMLPYLAQGANSALEDGASLGRILKDINSKEQLKHRIKAWQQLRKSRSEAIARETFGQRKSYHLPDGPEQEERDNLFEKWLGREPGEKFPSRWSCPEVQPWLWGYDAFEEADEAVAGIVRE